MAAFAWMTWKPAPYRNASGSSKATRRSTWCGSSTLLSPNHTVTPISPTPTNISTPIQRVRVQITMPTVAPTTKIAAHHGLTMAR